MPELSRFFGIIIRMYAEDGPHHVPHIHAYYQGEVGIYGLDPIMLIAGSLPKRQQRFVEAWQSYIRRSCWKIGGSCKTAANHFPSSL
jgi:hypothetical protein